MGDGLHSLPYIFVAAVPLILANSSYGPHNEEANHNKNQSSYHESLLESGSRRVNEYEILVKVFFWNLNALFDDPKPDLVIVSMLEIHVEILQKPLAQKNVVLRVVI